MKQHLIYLMTSTLNALTSNTSSRLYLYFLSGPVILLRFVFVTLYFTINDDDLKNNNIFALLMYDHTLLQRITPAHLNSTAANVDAVGMSTLFWLTAHAQGQQVLVHNSDLRQMITPEELNSVVENGDYAGVSALCCLAATPEGRQLLVNNHNLRQMITGAGLNSIAKHGQHKGMSALYCLSATSECSQLLVNDHNLRQEIKKVCKCSGAPPSATRFVNILSNTPSRDHRLNRVYNVLCGP
jgi:hypothetical protein